ncbi:DUF3108 domain-containing protein [Agaribacterium sp. ZY112]|uniref:DUF3108 domain-containing protein n=1 Tax=Agaribacterium sp. ZY112 TaxID=3233574 RepID=UPI00352407E0
MSKATLFISQPLLKQSPPVRFLLTLGIAAFFLTLLSTSASADSNNEKTLFTASYEGRHSGMKIGMVRSLKKDAKGYALSANASNFLGKINELSRFTLTNKQLIAQHYNYERSIFGKGSKQRIRFDWQANKAYYRRDDKPQKNKDFDIKLGTLDPSLYQLKLQQEVAQGKKHFELEFVKDSKVKTLEFHQTGLTSYELKNQELEAIQVERINKDDKKQTLILLAPKLNYQIVKIVHTEEDGSSHTIKLKDYQGDNTAMKEFYQAIE